ncbi:hypothetical protein C0Q70_15458 [Pomacea canaliculata]|uniref:Apple domain-containing protein n=1 Tax=Pomacea canaliculata TaxID=400727 RepID=A0A2T7NUX7_POMCA|nr:hypothetical protein C0Q70_15458 [Pomacea canaliculata]
MSSRHQVTSSSRCLDDIRVTSVVLVLCWILSLYLGHNDALRTVTFRKPLICPSQGPVENQTTAVVTSRSKLDCVVACTSSSLCQSIVYEPNSKTCHLSQLVVADSCPGTEDSKNRKMFLEKTALTMQRWDNSFRMTSELCAHGQRVFLRVLLHFRTDDYDGQSQQQSQLHETLARLSRRVWKLTKVTSTALDYTSMENTIAPVGDCLSDLRGANFSTYDSDNDGDSSVNCASRHSGGWWFRGNTCSTCNPTGQLLQPANGMRTGVDSEVFWIKDLGDVVPSRIRFSLANM